MYYILTSYSSNTYIAHQSDYPRVYFESAPAWTDKFTALSYAGSFDRTLDGGAVLQSFPQGTVGQPITLVDGYMSVARISALKALADAGSPVLFSEDNGSTTIECYLDYSQDNPIEIEYVDEFKVFAKVTVHLRRTT